jgi:hypothetical protein
MNCAETEIRASRTFHNFPNVSAVVKSVLSRTPTTENKTTERRSRYQFIRVPKNLPPCCKPRLLILFCFINGTCTIERLERFLGKEWQRGQGQ